MIQKIDITPQISYFPASEEPLSAEVVLIRGKKHTFIYDVGRIAEVCEFLADVDNSVVILSHFHGDHIENIHNLTPEKLFVSRHTYKYTHFGELVLNDTYIWEDGDGELVISDTSPSGNSPLIHIFPLPSSHAKGCLGLEVNGEAVFVGDALYGKAGLQAGEAYNYQLTQAAIKTLSGLSGETLYLGHRFNCKTSKKKMLLFLEEHLHK